MLSGITCPNLSSGCFVGATVPGDEAFGGNAGVRRSPCSFFPSCRPVPLFTCPFCHAKPSLSKGGKLVEGCKLNAKMCPHKELEGKEEEGAL